MPDLAGSVYELLARLDQLGFQRALDLIHFTSLFWKARLNFSAGLSDRSIVFICASFTTFPVLGTDR